MLSATCGNIVDCSAVGEGERCCCTTTLGDAGFLINKSVVSPVTPAVGATLNTLPTVAPFIFAAAEPQLPLLTSKPPLGVPGAAADSAGDVGDMPPRTEDATADVEYGEPAMLQGDLLAFELGATAAVVDDEAVEEEDEVDEVIDELEDEDDDDDDEEEPTTAVTAVNAPPTRIPVLGVGVMRCCW